MKYKKKLLATLVAMALSPVAISQNIGFEDGTSTGWSGNGISAVGTETLQAGSNQWTVNPYGSYMGKLTIASGTFSQMTSALSLTSASASGIQSTLTTQAQTTGNGGGNPTTASWASKTVTLTAGQTFTLAWQYISTDYVPFNDGSIATLVKVDNPNVTAVLNNYTSQYALLGFTNPGTGDYSTGSYGSTGWQTATYTVTESGDYLLGFGVFNLDDTALSPVLYVDEVIGTTLQNGQTFGAVAPNPGTSAPDTSSGSVTPPPTPDPTPTPPPAPTLVSNVTGTTGTDVLASGSITVNGGTIQIMMTGATLTQLFDVQAGGMTVDQNSNTATLNGVISGTGNVVIANSGTGGSITFTAVNTYTGSTTINQGATLINDGNIASSSSVINNGTVTNNGTVGSVVNNSLFTNNGTAGSVNNTGAFANNGTTGNVDNSGTFLNAGSTGDVSNSGVFVNNGTVGMIFPNSGTFNNNGTAGQVLNEGTFNNAGSTSDVINAGTFNNTGSTGAVENSGVFTSTGTIASIVNSGTLDVTGTTSAIGSYTQLPTGTTLMSYSNPITVTNDATLAGRLEISEAPTAYGRYTILTANSISGEYSLFSSNGVNDYLKYAGNNVKLYVTPSAQLTTDSINSVAGDVSSMNNLQSGVINNSLSNDCNLFGDTESCVSVNYSNTAASTGDLAAGGITLAKRISDNWRAGLYLDAPFNSPTIGSVKQTNNPAYGGFITWNEFEDGTGLGAQAAIVTNSGKMTVTRNGPETGTGTAKTDGTAYQFKVTYAAPLNDTLMFTDYVGIRHTQLNIGGYTESGAVFPLTVSGTQQSTTDLIAGAGLSYKITDSLTANTNLGIIQNVSKNGGNFSGNSEIGNLQTFNTALPATRYTSAALGAGVTYQLTQNQRVGASIGWQQKGLVNSDITSFGVSYTVGF